MNGAATIEQLNAGTKVPKDTGAKCVDACDGARFSQGSWVNKINMRKPSTYVYRWTCSDKTSGKKTTVHCKYLIVDRTAPTIQLTGKSSITLEAIPKTKYVDQGAMCHDYVDGNLKSAVKTRYENGKKPNYAVPGTYRVYYDCKDQAGNKATPLMRVVKVQDTTRPVIKVVGKSVLSIEAGFPPTMVLPLSTLSTVLSPRRSKLGTSAHRPSTFNFACLLCLFTLLV